MKTSKKQDGSTLWKFTPVTTITLGTRTCTLSKLVGTGGPVPIKNVFAERLKTHHHVEVGEFLPAMQKKVLAAGNIVRGYAFAIPLRDAETLNIVVPDGKTITSHKVPLKGIQVYSGMRALVLSGPPRAKAASRKKTRRQSTPVGVAKMRVSTQKPRSQRKNPKAPRQA